MNNSEKSLRAVCILNGQRKTILKLTKKGNDFYSSIAGRPGHSSYHESGKTHINHGKWGEKDYQTNMIMRDKVIDIKSYKLIQAISFLNHAEVILNPNLFKKHKETKDLKIDINCSELEENSAIVIISGIAKHDFSYSQFSKENLNPAMFDFLDYIELVENEIKVFILALNIKRNSNSEIIKLNYEKIGLNTNIQFPTENFFLVYEYGQTSLCIFGFDFGPPPHKIFDNRPALPKTITEHTISQKLTLKNLKHNGSFIRIGNLSLGALPESEKLFLHLFVVQINQLNTKTMGNIEYIASIKNLYFYYVYGGHDVQQFKIGNDEYQIELSGVTERREHLDDEMIQEYYLTIWKI